MNQEPTFLRLKAFFPVNDKSKLESSLFTTTVCENKSSSCGRERAGYSFCDIESNSLFVILLWKIRLDISCEQMIHMKCQAIVSY